MREKAYLREVGLRDGLQMVRCILSSDRKVEWCREEAAAGVGEIEVTSFVPPKIVPQFADAVEVAERTGKIGGFRLSALVPNLKGAERGFELGVHKLNYVLSASETHNLANVRRSTEDSIEDFRRIVQARAHRGLGKVLLGAGVATAFGCTMEGAVDEGRVVEIIDRLLDAGADEIIVADTVGYGNPAQVRRLMGRVVERCGDVPVAAHFHDTRGLGLANVTAAVEAGVRRFDASLGGLGGCPFAPGATGNIDSEDCAFLLESMGFDTGIDIDALIALRQKVETWLPDEKFYGMVAKAGLPKHYRPASALAA